MIEMVAEATSSGIQTNHFLFDRSLAYPVTLSSLLVNGMRAQDHDKVLSSLSREYFHLEAIYRKRLKRRGSLKKVAPVIVGIGEDDKGIPVQAKIAFVRNWCSKKK
jgi:hypothetical protein